METLIQGSTKRRHERIKGGLYTGDEFSQSIQTRTQDLLVRNEERKKQENFNDILDKLQLNARKRMQEIKQQHE
jgi:hypothetical protein